MLFTDPDGAIRAMLTGSSNAVTLAMTLIATYGFWLGFFALMDKTGVSDFIAKILKPVIRLLFKDADEKTRKYISMNMSANLLGLGNVAAAYPLHRHRYANSARLQRAHGVSSSLHCKHRDFHRSGRTSGKTFLAHFRRKTARKKKETSR